jgi:hypothetical protein
MRRKALKPIETKHPTYSLVLKHRRHLLLLNKVVVLLQLLQAPPQAQLLLQMA